ncbi:MAG: type I DNA topoisomerase [Bdellovibrionota bacterium]
MSKSLVIVESPTKAKTIRKFLGDNYIVEASFGHVRDLPNNASEIPEEVKKEKWTRLGINVENNFEPLYVIPASKKKKVAELKKLLKEADYLLLATDGDREGESISWHLLKVLKPKVPVKRLLFNEITKKAIDEALNNTIEIDDNLVKAQETRRFIDRLFGYTVSPLLWKKMVPRLSAGRVQSVAIRLLVERERERINFKSANYWDIKGVFSKKEKGESFEAMLSSVGGKKVALSKDFEPTTGKLLNSDNVILLNEKSAKELEAKLKKEKVVVSSIVKKDFITKPQAPFVTSSLQQEANKRLKFTAKMTMQVAQSLYENGFITYMRTDSTNLSTEALSACKTLIKKEYGEEYLSPNARVYKTQVRNAQEAHEAIRPAGSSFTPISEVKAKLGIEASKLYEMIYKRTLASQMKDALGERVNVELNCRDAIFKASGKVVKFLGHLRAYSEDESKGDKAKGEEAEGMLPKLELGEELNINSLTSLSHDTEPPYRYTEGSLIKELESRGIGRPSTWATIVDVVLSRTYAFKKQHALVPTFLGMAVTSLMEKDFSELVDYKFTANLEDDLDAIARGEKNNINYLSDFYFGNSTLGLEALVKRGEEVIDPKVACGIFIGKDGEKTIEVRIGKFGPFLTDGEVTSALPNMMCPDELTLEKAKELLEIARKGPVSLGKGKDGKNIYVKTGRFGPYVQLGENDEEPKMVSLLSNMKLEDVSLDVALKLLELPKILGVFPDNNEDIIVANGKFGPYIQAGKETRSLGDISPIEITLNEAISILHEPKRRGRGRKNTLNKELGKDLVSEETIYLKSGVYGPYVTNGKINASVPVGYNIDEISLDDAISLLQARAIKLASLENESEEKGEIKEKNNKEKNKKEKAKKETSKTKANTSKTSNSKTSKVNKN